VILTTHAGRRLEVTVDHDWDRGLAYYAIARVGTFTLGWDRLGDDSTSIEVDYGRHPGGYRSGYEYLPEAPTMFGIKLIGAAVFSPERVDPDRPWGWIHGRRRLSHLSSVQVPDGTNRRLAEVVACLVEHWAAAPEHDALHAAFLRDNATYHLGQLASQIRYRQEKVDVLMAEMDDLNARADIQRSYLLTPVGALAS
jgi:hypothetical protein